MKKILTSLAVIMAVSAVKAACISWSMSLPNSIVTDKAGDPYSSTIYLIVADDLSGLANPEQSKEEFMAALNAIKLNDEFSATSEGKTSGISKIFVNNPLIDAGDTVGALIVSEYEGKGYYRYATKIATVFSDGTPEKDQQATMISWNTVKNATWNQGYTVPEPATGALALAGLALLFRRRRA